MASKRPETREELQKREAIGVIRASRFVNIFAKQQDSITFETIEQIHHIIFGDAQPDIAGKLRSAMGADVKKLHYLLPPPHQEVPHLVAELDDELAKKQEVLKAVPVSLVSTSELQDEEWKHLGRIIEAAAWLHHRIVYIHPFIDGNGRTARLAANLLLKRYGLIGVSIKIEAENKNTYLNALKQADAEEDYDPLIRMIMEDMIDRYRSITNSK